jgi:DNA-directed RNA polymerase subunit E'/Rpb7
MDNIYFNCILTKKIVVEAKYLNENIDEYINEYFKKKIESTCIDEGYVKENSIKILKRSIGILLGSRFTGDITYDVAYTANICNPVIGNVIDCKVKFINKLGILGNNGPITIIIGKQFHINNNDFNKISENDIVKVEVIDKKFCLNDKEIKIIAKLWEGDKSNSKIVKKELISSDLTPILNDKEDYEYNLNNEDYYEEEDIEDEEDEEEYDEEDEENLYDEEDDDIKVENPDDNKIENPDDNNLDADDIELDYEEETEETEDSED